MKRRGFLGVVAAGAAGVLIARPSTAASQVIEVYKEPTCGCCGKWIEHVRASGFVARVNEVRSVDALKAQVGLPSVLASCHTALIDGYVIEGHVPAADIRQLLAERPKARGLAVPGMPAIAPGMDGTHGPGYKVLLFQADGTTQVYHAYPSI
jgi:hypothetical protein